MAIDPLTLARIAVTAIQNFGLALALGALLCARWLGHAEGLSAWRDALRFRLRATVRAGAGLIVVAVLPMAWLEAATMSGTGLREATASVLPMIQETHYGHAWLAGAAVSVALLVLAARPARASTRLARMLVGAGLAAFALTKSLSGHAADAGTWSLPVLADWIHILSIGIWVGTVVVSAVVVAPRVARASGLDRRTCVTFVQSLSDTATVALCSLLVTGAYAAWRIVGTLQSLMHTDYGHTLLVKLMFVAVCIGLGAFNRFIDMPQLLAALPTRQPVNGKPPAQRFMRILSIEAVFLLGALLMAATLVGTPPPGA